MIKNRFMGKMENKKVKMYEKRRKIKLKKIKKEGKRMEEK